MNKNLNRKKIIFYSNKRLIYFIFISLFLCILILIYLYKVELEKNIYKKIQSFSENFDYQLKNTEVIGIKNINIVDIENIVSKYYYKSIFLLPLKNISISLRDINWIKKVKLKTNYKNTLIVEIQEYIPLGIYSFNNKMFYFEKSGKIIDIVNQSNLLKKNLLIFSGQSSNLYAKNIINEIDKLKNEFKSKIIKIDLIENRRWNIIIENNIILMLSEKFPNKSLENFIKLIKNLDDIELNKIESFDLRNIDKTIIKYKYD